MVLVTEQEEQKPTGEISSSNEAKKGIAKKRSGKEKQRESTKNAPRKGHARMVTSPLQFNEV